MADEKEQLIYEVVFDSKQAEERSRSLVGVISQLKSELAATKKEFKDGLITQDEYNQSVASIEKQLRAANAAQRENNKAIADNDKIQKSAVGSLTQMRATLAALNAEYIALSKSERDNVNTGVQLQQRIRALTDELKELESAYGSNQRNVGNYGETIQKNTELIDENHKSITDYLKSINVMGINVGQTATSFKEGTAGVKTFTSAVFTGRGALIALSAVPIVLFLTAVVSFFTRSKEGAELFGAKMAALGAVLDFALGKVVSLGKNIIEAFSKPGEAITKLGSLIKENLENRVKAFGVILDGIINTDFSKLRDGFIQLFTGITDAGGKIEALTADALAAAEAGEAIARQAYAIADAERALNVERANSRAQVEKLKLLSDDVSKSNEERMQATAQAYAIENSLLERQQALQKRKIENIKAENALRPESKEGLDKLAEAEERLGELAEESFTRQTELNNKLNQIRIEGERNALSVQIANAESRLNQAKLDGEKTYDIEKEILDKRLALSRAGIVKGSDEEKALLIQYATELHALQLRSAQDLEDQQDRIRQEGIERRLAMVKQGSQEEFDLLREAAAARNDIEFAQLARNVRNQEEFNAKFLALQAKFEAELTEITRREEDRRISLRNAAVETSLAKSKAGSREELEARTDLIHLQRIRELNNANLSAEERIAINARANRAIDDAYEEFAKQQATQILDGYSQLTGAIGSVINEQIAGQQRAIDAQQNAALKSAGLSAEAREQIEEQFQEKREKLEKEAAEKRRKIALIEATIGTAKAIVSAAPNPVLMALAGVVGALQIAVISSQQFAKGGIIPEKMAKGGIVNGPSHANGGVKYNVGGHNVELEGGEGVINKHSMKHSWVRELASKLNQIGGGVSFSNSPYVPASRMEYGGIVPRSSTSIDYSAMRSAMSQALQDLPPSIVQVEDIQSGVGRKVYVQERASY